MEPCVSNPCINKYCIQYAKLKTHLKVETIKCHKNIPCILLVKALSKYSGKRNTLKVHIVSKINIYPHNMYIPLYHSTFQTTMQSMNRSEILFKMIQKAYKFK
jgi:hypothetical protein